jgi:hypothetical protein
LAEGSVAARKFEHFYPFNEGHRADKTDRPTMHTQAIHSSNIQTICLIEILWFCGLWWINKILVLQVLQYQIHRYWMNEHYNMQCIQIILITIINFSISQPYKKKSCFRVNNNFGWIICGRTADAAVRSCTFKTMHLETLNSKHIFMTDVVYKPITFRIDQYLNIMN